VSFERGKNRKTHLAQKRKKWFCGKTKVAVRRCLRVSFRMGARRCPGQQQDRGKDKAKMIAPAFVAVKNYCEHRGALIWWVRGGQGGLGPRFDKEDRNRERAV